MKGNIIGTLLCGNLEEFKSVKSFLLYLLRMVISVGGIVYFLHSIQFLDYISVAYYFSAIAIGTFTYSFLFILSTFLYNQKAVLFSMLPIKKEELFFYIGLDLLLEIFITKFIPLFVGIGIYQIVRGQIVLSIFIEEVIKGLLVFISFSSMALVAVIYIGIRNRICIGISFGMAVLLFIINAYLAEELLIWFIIVAIILCSISYLIFCKYFQNVIQINKQSKRISGSLLAREFRMFFSDKVLVINFLICTGFCLIAVGSMIVNHIHLNFMIAIMVLLPLFSVTTFALYSYERERVKLLQSLPLPIISVFLNKYILSLTLTESSVLIISCILLIGKVTGIDFVLLYALSTLFICAEKILLDMAKPHIDFSHTEELLRSSRKYKMYGICVLGYSPMLLQDIGLSLVELCIISLIVNCIIIASLLLIIKKNNNIVNR